MTMLAPALATPADAPSATSLDSAMNEQSWILLVRAQGGNREAFGQLYQLHHARIYRYLAERLHDHATAEDLTGDTFSPLNRAPAATKMLQQRALRRLRDAITNLPLQPANRAVAIADPRNG